jgi:shikimate dehydrogenase
MTRRACVVGWPVAHSRSPLIHGYWLERYGIAGEYRKEAVRPEDLACFLRNLPDWGYVGCNVTLPHKEGAFRAVEIADEATRRLGAVNTIFMRDGQVWGTNTDGEGFLANLRSSQPSWSGIGARITILGAGGAARAIAGALLAEGCAEIVIINRSRERAEDLCRHFRGPLRVAEWKEIGAELPGADLLVNTTTLGMTGQAPLEIDLDLLARRALVADIVYAPLETSLIRKARAAGHPVAPGLGMLLHQAVRGFELWFGVRPEVTPDLHGLVAADIARSHP